MSKVHFTGCNIKNDAIVQFYETITPSSFCLIIIKVVLTLIILAVKGQKKKKKERKQINLLYGNKNPS